MNPEYFKHYKSLDPIIILQRNFFFFFTCRGLGFTPPTRRSGQWAKAPGGSGCQFCSFLKHAVSWILYSDHEFHLLGVMLCCIGSVSGRGGMTVLVPIFVPDIQGSPCLVSEWQGFPLSQSSFTQATCCCLFFSFLYFFCYCFLNFTQFLVVIMGRDKP